MPSPKGEGFFVKSLIIVKPFLKFKLITYGKCC